MVSKRFQLLLYWTSIILIIFGNKYNAQDYITTDNGWRVAELYVNASSLFVNVEPDKDSKKTKQLHYFDKVLVIEIDDEILTSGWARIIYPVEGYVGSTNLTVVENQSEQNDETKNKSKNNWFPQIVYGVNKYNFIKSDPSFDSRNIAVLKSGEPSLIIIDNELPKKTWHKVLYPSTGYINSEDIETNQNQFSFEFGFSFSPVSIPYEKNFKNLKNPIGGYLKFSNATWNLGLRVYYTIGTSHVGTYELETHRGGAEITYDFVKLFDDAFAIYGFAGGGYWASTFQNTKYPDMAYYKAETDSGPMYSAGAGINYTLYGFVLDVHYSWFGTEEGVFGPNSLPGQFTNQYKLFTSSHQLVTMLGYKIEL